MATQVRIPTPLRKLTREEEVVSIDGANIGEILTNLEKSYPGIGERLYDEAGNVRLLLAEPKYCGDNAAMIAGLAGAGGGVRGAAAMEIDAVPSLTVENVGLEVPASLL